MTPSFSRVNSVVEHLSVAAFAIAVFIEIISTGCIVRTGNSPVRLCGDYFLHRTSGTSIDIRKGETYSLDDPYIPSTVIGIALHEPLIFARVSDPMRAHDDDSQMVREEYWVLYTSGDRVFGPMTLSRLENEFNQGESVVFIPPHLYQ